MKAFLVIDLLGLPNKKKKECKANMPLGCDCWRPVGSSKWRENGQIFNCSLDERGKFLITTVFCVHRLQIYILCRRIISLPTCVGNFGQGVFICLTKHYTDSHDMPAYRKDYVKRKCVTSNDSSGRQIFVSVCIENITSSQFCF